MNILDGLKIFVELSQSDRENFSNFCQERYLKKGDVLFSEGEEATAMYILKTGSFEVLKTINGEDVVLGEVKAEEVLGEMALFGDNNKRMATAICKEDSVLIIVLSFSILEMTKKNPELLEKIKNIINDRIMNNKMKVEKL